MSRKKIFGNRMKDSVKAREEISIPTYTLTRKKRTIPKPVFICILLALTIFSTIYLPPILTTAPEVHYHASVDLSNIADPTAMQAAQSYLSNHPEADFDNDGLTNEEELNIGTGIYIPDNDDDGTSDYAELYLTETNPRQVDDAIVKYVISADNKTGNSVQTPFKVHDIVMWADDYPSKARGSVIPLTDGSYNFYHFTGWVQFPEAMYAYKVVDGFQTPLQKNESGYFYIDTDNLVNIRIYQEKPESRVVLYLFGNQFVLPDNWATRSLNFILPSHGSGIIISKLALENDLDGSWTEAAKVNEKSSYRADAYPDERFGCDQQTTLSTLSDIMREIDDGNNVIVSLMSHSVGENIVEVYGYTNRGNLLVCDPATGEDYGIINISIISERMLDQSGNIVPYEHFTFVGCGYSSAARHRFVVVDYVEAGTTVHYEGPIESTNDDDSNVPVSPSPVSVPAYEPTSEPVSSTPVE